MNFAKNLKKLIRVSAKIAAGIISLLLVCLVITAVLIARWPSLLITPKTLSLTASYLEKQGFRIHWKSVQTSVESISVYDKWIRLNFSEVCWKVASYEGCHEQAAISVRLNLKTMPPTITEAGPLSLLGGTLKLKTNESAAEVSSQKTTDAEDTTDWIPEWLQNIKFGRIEIDLKEVQWIFPEEVFNGSITLKSGEKTSTQPGLNWELRLSEKSQSQRAHLVLHLDNPYSQLKGPFSIQSSGNLRLTEGPRVRFSFVLNQIGEKLSDLAFSYAVSGNILQKGLNVTARVHGHADLGPTGHIQATINGHMKDPVKNLRTLAVNNCSISLKRRTDEIYSGHLFLNCPILAQLDLRRSQRARQLQVPDHHSAIVRADLLTSFLPSPENPIQGQVSLHMPKTSMPYLDVTTELTSAVRGVPSEFPKDWTTQTDLNLSIEVADFDKLVQTLSTTDYAIPAPLNALQGSLSIKINGTGNLTEGQFPLAMRTHLDSATQQLDLNGSGQFNFSREEEQWLTSLGLQLLLSNVQLQLPPLPLGLPPRFFPDSRIVSASQAAKKNAPTSPGFLYDIQVRTPDDQPIRIRSNLAKKPVPIDLNLRLKTEQPVSGTLSVSQFPLVAFNRDATVERFKLSLGETPKIDGSMRVKYTDYTVKVNISGPTDEPQIRLTSDPPLPEDQLVSVLLFGRTPEELDPNEGESFGDARAAMQARAISLASLYLLASTPVESIGYDTRTNGLSAKFRLGAGTSLNIATGLETPHFGLRKRLSRYWTLTTDVTPLSETGSIITAFLEWTYRY